MEISESSFALLDPFIIVLSYSNLDDVLNIYQFINNSPNIFNILIKKIKSDMVNVLFHRYAFKLDIFSIKDSVNHIFENKNKNKNDKFDIIKFINNFLRNINNFECIKKQRHELRSQK